MLIYCCFYGILVVEFIVECVLEDVVDKIFVDEVVNELYIIQDMLCWVVSCFSVVNIWYGYGIDNLWDEVVQLVLFLLYLLLDILEDMCIVCLIFSEKYCIVEWVICCVNECIFVVYLINKVWFCGYEFYVDEWVLVLCFLIGELINNQFVGLINYKLQYIFDMCIGSGCIVIVCVYVFLEVEVDVVDIFLDVLVVVEYNVEFYGLIYYVMLICFDLFCDLLKLQYDLIVINLLYVDEEDMVDLLEEYEYELVLGLVFGSDGLKLMCCIFGNVLDYFSDDGILICEVGNSMVYLMEQYLDVLFIWFEFDNGGDGVFMLIKQQLIDVCVYFGIYKD